MADIAVSELHKYYGDKHVLKGVTFEVYEGEKVGLIGKNGTGKTTLFKILAGTENYESGRMSTAGGKRVGVLDQIPDYPKQYTVLDVLKTAFEKQYTLLHEMRELENRMESDAAPELLMRYGRVQSEFEAMGGYTLENEIFRVCTGLSIDTELQEKEFHLLSGGEKTRVNLGRIILQGTEILLLDEPTNHLDIRSVEWLEEFLTAYKGSVVVISHDRYFLDKVITRTFEIAEGQIERYEGNYTYYVREREARYLQQLARYEQEQKKIKQLEEAAKKMHEWANNADNPALHKRAFAMEKRIERMEKTEKPIKEKDLTARFQENTFSGKEIILLEGVSKAYGDQQVLKGITLTVGKNERIALIGNNGCGKTTLLRILTGEETPDAGVARVGESVRYNFLQQTVIFERPEFTVLDTVRYALETNEETARRKLAAFHFKGKDLFTQVQSLSGGEKSRLRLCIMMQGNANLLILDEPTNHLDIRSREWIEEAISSFAGTILFVSHDRYFINRFATRVWEMEEGQITDYSGTFEEYRGWKSRVEAVPAKIVEKVKEPAMHSKRKEREAESSTRRIQEIEERITELENRIAAVDQEMGKSTDGYEHVAVLFEEKNELVKELELLYEEWESLQQE